LGSEAAVNYAKERRACDPYVEVIRLPTKDRAAGKHLGFFSLLNSYHPHHAGRKALARMTDAIVTGPALAKLGKEGIKTNCLVCATRMVVSAVCTE